MPPKLSVVDYDAWKRGYMPPSEHVLIDALSYRGAKVCFSGPLRDGQYWLAASGDGRLSDIDDLNAVIATLLIYRRHAKRKRNSRHAEQSAPHGGPQDEGLKPDAEAERERDLIAQQRVGDNLSPTANE